jgi:hypothetical protein
MNINHLFKTVSEEDQEKIINYDKIIVVFKELDNGILRST